jgi:hypothetical protein
MPLFYFCQLLLTILAEGRNPGYSSNESANNSEYFK